MMLQQINLLAELPAQAELTITLPRVMWLAVACLILLLLISIPQYFSVREQRNEVAKLHEVEASAMQKLLQQSKQVNTLLSPEKLSTEVNRLRGVIAEKRIVARPGMGKSNLQGFSSTFTKLAEINMNGLWLSGISLTQGGEQITLRGVALRPELVKTYVDQLMMSHLLWQKQLKTVRATEMDARTDTVSFVLSTEEVPTQ